MRTMLLFCFASCVVASLLAAEAHSTEPKRPNILFALADDWGRYASAYAKVDGPGTLNDAIQTPNFDRIAREGVLFRTAFVSSPSCTPCRSAILSGQHFWRAGRASILQGAIWDGSVVAYPALLESAGYQLGETYKVCSPGTPVDAPYGGGKYAYERAGKRFNNFSEEVIARLAKGESIEQAKQVLYDEVLANFDDFLTDRKSDQPFCYWFGPTNVHRSWQKGSGKNIWGIDPDSLKGKRPPFLADVPEVREDLADYLGEVQAFDGSLGILLKRLEEIGQLDNTLIVVSGDHGAPGFQRGKCNLYDFGVGVSLAIRGPGVQPGRVVDDLISLTDLAPTFLEYGQVEVPAAMTGRSLVPLLKSTDQGQVDPQRTAVFFGRERHVEDAREGYVPYPQRAIRTPDYLYIVNFKPDRWPLGDPYWLDGDHPPTEKELTDNTRVTLADDDSSPAKAWLVLHRNDPQWRSLFELAYNKRPREELYELKHDPHEMVNVAADPKFASVREKLSQQLMAELHRTGDPRLIDEGKFFETPPMAGPIETPKK